MMMIQIINSIIHDNSATRGSGFWAYQSSKPNLVNVTISNNSDPNNSGPNNYRAGITSWGQQSHPVLFNCILWNNSPAEIDLDQQANQLAYITVTYSDIYGGYTGTGNGNWSTNGYKLTFIIEFIISSFLVLNIGIILN